MFGPFAPFWITTFCQFISETGSMSVTPAPSMELTPHQGTPTRRPFPYLLPSDILGCSLGLPPSQAVNVNVAPLPMITRLSTHSTPQVSTVVVPQIAQSPPFNASIGSPYMPSISHFN